MMPKMKYAVTNLSACYPLASGYPLVESVRALARDSECAINPDSNLCSEFTIPLWWMSWYNSTDHSHIKTLSAKFELFILGERVEYHDCPTSFHNSIAVIWNEFSLRKIFSYEIVILWSWKCLSNNNQSSCHYEIWLSRADFVSYD